MNELLTLSLFDKYLIKELTGEEFQEKTCYESDCQALTRLFIETRRGADENSVKAEAEELVNRLNGVRRSFGIYYDKEYIGYVAFTDYDNKNPEIQIELSEPFRNKGIGFRVLSLLINQIFQEREDIEYFIYCVRVDNIASVKLVEKLGGKKIQTGNFVEQIIAKYYLFRR